MDPLMYEGLTPQQRLDLGRTSETPGFAVIKLLLDDACDKSLKAVIKVSPEDPEYDQKVKARQLVSRVTNDVCATLIKSIIMHSEVAKVQANLMRAQKELQAELAEGGDAPKPLGEKFGSFVIKPRKNAKQKSNPE
jgi:hypothetical protein